MSWLGCSTRLGGVAFCLGFLLSSSIAQTSKHGNLTPDFLGELMNLAAMNKSTFEKSLANGYHRLDTWGNPDQVEELKGRLAEFDEKYIFGDFYVMGGRLGDLKDVNTDFLKRFESNDVITLCRYSSKDYVPFSMIQGLNEKGFHLDIKSTESRAPRLYPNSFWYKKGHYYIRVTFLPYLVKKSHRGGFESSYSTVISESCATYYKNKTID